MDSPCESSKESTDNTEASLLKQQRHIGLDVPLNVKNEVRRFANRHSLTMSDVILKCIELGLPRIDEKEVDRIRAHKKIRFARITSSMPSVIEVGEKYGKLLVHAREGSGLYRRTTWFCQCTCGRQRIVKSRDLICGRIVECRQCEKERKEGNESTL